MKENPCDYPHKACEIIFGEDNHLPWVEGYSFKAWASMWHKRDGTFTVISYLKRETKKNNKRSSVWKCCKREVASPSTASFPAREIWRSDRPLHLNGFPEDNRLKRAVWKMDVLSKPIEDDPVYVPNNNQTETHHLYIETSIVSISITSTQILLLDNISVSLLPLLVFLFLSSVPWSGVRLRLTPMKAVDKERERKAKDQRV